MKKLGRSHQAFFRICAVDKRAPRDGRVLEELGTYDPRVPETDARAILKAERVDYWIGVGAQPSDNVAVLIKKFDPCGSTFPSKVAPAPVIVALVPRTTRFAPATQTSTLAAPAFSSAAATVVEFARNLSQMY